VDAIDDIRKFVGPLLCEEMLVSLAKEVVDGPNPLFCPFA
jgi:hypothetical protein